MSALAHVFEAAGLATVGLSLVRGQAEDGRAPRMLHCDFPLGRPLGRPSDPDFQHRVLATAFDLLPRVDVPVLVDFPESIDDESASPLSCVLPPRHDTDVHPAVDESKGLRVAYERQRQRTGRTGVTNSGGPDAIPDLISVMAEIANGTPTSEVALTQPDLPAAARDIRAYYEEAAVALADHVPGARQAESWFYRITETGRILIQAQTALRSSGAPREVWSSFVPISQPTT